ncbi:hypothetical protein [Amnibacterium endophyticum]|uniref:TrwC relaxase domain-containing protein n=1 Tax=Amnibacterium endophyticum TaxID=2109337 RepID=A0ABW4LGN8_9MICO
MSDQHPGVEDEVEAALRLGLATASQMADRYARARQDSARQAEHRAQQEVHQLEARYRAEGASATARLALVDRPEWWDRAAPADITSMWQLAAQWQHEQPRAAVAADTITRQVQDRYGIDVHATGVDTDTVRAALARLDQDRAGRDDQRQGHDDTATAVTAVLRADQRDAALTAPATEPERTAAADASEADRALLLELEADQYDRQVAEGGTSTSTVEELRALSANAHAQAALHCSDASVGELQANADLRPAYDSRERREQTEFRLRETGLAADAVAVAMRADVAHARPAAEAVTENARTPRATGSRATSRSTQRPERSR